MSDSNPSTKDHSKNTQPLKTMMVPLVTYESVVEPVVSYPKLKTPKSPTFRSAFAVRTLWNSESHLKVDNRADSVDFASDSRAVSMDHQNRHPMTTPNRNDRINRSSSSSTAPNERVSAISRRLLTASVDLDTFSWGRKIPGNCTLNPIQIRGSLWHF